MLSGASDTLAEIRQAEPQAWQEQQTGIEQACSQIRARGFCITEGGWQREVNGVAVPLAVKYAGGQLSLSCGGPAQDMSVQRMEQELGPMLIAVAREIEMRVPH